MKASDVAILAAVIVGSGFWGWIFRVVWTERLVMSSGRLTNLILAAILGLLVGWFITVTSGCSIDAEDSSQLEPPEPRCSGLSFSSCQAMVSNPDSGVD